MRAFFHGWRRKTGCVMLAMALVLAGAWMRGYLVCDQIELYGRNGAYLGTSFAGQWSLRRYTHSRLSGHSWESTKPLPVGYLREVGFGMRTRDDYRFHVAGLNVQAGQWWDFGGPFDMDPRVGNEQRFIRVDVDCWMIVLPVTLLSAYLILGKPRKRLW